MGEKSLPPHGWCLIGVNLCVLRRKGKGRKLIDQKYQNCCPTALELSHLKLLTFSFFISPLLSLQPFIQLFIYFFSYLLVSFLFSCLLFSLWSFLIRLPACLSYCWGVGVEFIESAGCAKKSLQKVFRFCSNSKTTS